MSRAYYNEWDPFCARRLRKLVATGRIPAGEVDERDIREVSGDDLKGYGQVHLFAGIGGWPHALQLAGWPDDRPVWTASCPCPPFSVAGKKLSCPECESRLLVWCPRQTGFAMQFAAMNGWPTPATYGRKYGGWQPSDALNESLASRLRAMLPTTGSPEYELRWRSSVTLLELPIYRLRASARPTLDSAYGGWPTPVANDDNKSPEAHMAMKARMGGGRKAITSLQVMVQLAGWATLRKTDGDKGVRSNEGAIGENLRTRGPDLCTQAKISGPTSTSFSARTEKRGALNPAFSLWLMGFPSGWLD